MAPRNPSQSSLSGQLLVAMPQMADPRFARTVVYLCAHSADGAMGLVVNRLIDSLNFGSLLAQLGLETEGAPADMPVQAPAKFEIVANLRTAQMIGLTFPAQLVAAADHVIR